MDAIKLTPEAVIEAYKNAGLGEKRLNRAQQTNTQMPTAGKFQELSFSSFKDDKGIERKYPVLVVVNKDGKKIGNVAVGTIMQQVSTGKARLIRNDKSEYFGQWFHAGKALNSIDGMTEAEQVANLIGKSFTAKEKKDTIIPKINIVDGKPVFYSDEETAIKAVETKDCYVFNILD